MESQDVKLTIAKVEDLVRWVIRNQNWNTTWFLDPATQVYVERYLEKSIEINYKKSGGYPTAERKIFAIYPHWMEFDDNLFPYSCLSVEWNDKFFNLGHRDILGSVLGLGIERHTIGDIIVKKNIAYVIMMKDISNFVLANLATIGRAKVKLSKIDLANLDLPEPKYKSIHTTVSSMRLDCLASTGFGYSRNKILPLIREGRLFVNWEQITKPDFQIKEGDIITLRGSGRIKISEITGFTKKNRIAVIIYRFT
ncbi:MAG: RNA-binding protein [Clostridiales bacterium]|nr:RNA-binding protein [Clostridiales bacterium]